MSSYRTDRTLADFIAGALSPPLIMALVGSLVFFLLEIVYQGTYMGMLQWVLFFFIFGAVLIARIAMSNDSGGRAGTYGFLLGGGVWLALQLYVDYSATPGLAGRGGIINLGLIVLIWWSAHRLTYDCTLIDDDETNNGVGLLEVTGLEAAAREAPSDETKKPKKDAPGIEGWWQRYQRYQAQRKRRPRTAGVWVVFFSLAALPLFGLGQGQIPAHEQERRLHAFHLLVLYVGSGLGLLLTTSFLGLRCYLRQRRVTMPVAITLLWLMLGSVLVGTLLFVGDLLPRPADPQPLWAWTGFIGSPPLEPNPQSPFKQQKKVDAADKDTKSDAKPDAAKGTQTAKTTKGDKGDKENKSDKKGVGEKDEPEDKEKSDEPATVKEQGAGLPGALAPLMDGLIKLGRWLIIIMVALVIGCWILRGVLQFLANFTLWAEKLLGLVENLWQNLHQNGAAQAEPAKLPAPPRAFASFANPFANGQAENLAPADLVRYSFAALEAWGREHDLSRAPAATAQEYIARIGADFPELGEQAAKLARLYGRLAYSTDSVTVAHGKTLRKFWQVLTAELSLAGKEED